MSDLGGSGRICLDMSDLGESGYDTPRSWVDPLLYDEGHMGYMGYIRYMGYIASIYQTFSKDL